MWFTLSSVTYGMLSALDPMLFIYIAYTLDVSGVYMGMLSAAWSAAYILCNRLSGSLADDGHNKVLAILALASVAPIYILLSNLSHFTALLAYTLHAASMAFLNLAISVTLLEYVESSYWDKVNLLSRIINNISRGLMLIIIALLGLNVLNEILYIIVFMLLIVSVVLPHIYISFERKFYTIERTLSRIGMYVKATASLLYVDQPKTFVEVFSRTWNSSEAVSPVGILIGAMGAVAVGDYIFTVIPVILKGKLQLTSMWIVYGFSALASAVTALTLNNIEASGARKAFTIFVLRLLALVLGFSFLSDMTSLALYVVLSSTLFMLLDVVLYNTYVYTQAGFRTSSYFVARELGSIVGSLLGGVAIDLDLYTFLLIAIAIGLTTSLPLLIE
jgi:hypothetical protein